MSLILRSLLFYGPLRESNADDETLSNAIKLCNCLLRKGGKTEKKKKGLFFVASELHLGEHRFQSKQESPPLIWGKEGDFMRRRRGYLHKLDTEEGKN